MQEQIEQTLRAYIQAVHQQDFETMYELLDKDHLEDYKRTMGEFAEKMDVFGETEEFLRRLGILSLDELKSMPTKTFMLSIFRLSAHEIGAEELKRMTDNLHVISIDKTEFMSIVNYEFPVKIFGEWEIIQSEINMIWKEDRWQIFFQSSLREHLESFQVEIDQYYERKAKDNLDKLRHEDDLTPFTVVGYKNAKGEVLIEPRFREAEEFSEGLACVQIMRKYGYIDLRGELAIKPQFLKAQAFYEGRAAVRVEVNGPERKWGFIDTSGEMIISPVYEEVTDFSDGLCAVKKEDKWGYIDTDGEPVLPFQFVYAEPFEFGEAEVSILTSDGEMKDLTIDKAGNVVG